jgi:hypothetical protein
VKLTNLCAAHLLVKMRHALHKEYEVSADFDCLRIGSCLFFDLYSQHTGLILFGGVRMGLSLFGGRPFGRRQGLVVRPMRLVAIIYGARQSLHMRNMR